MRPPNIIPNIIYRVIVHGDVDVNLTWSIIRSLCCVLVEATFYVNATCIQQCHYAHYLCYINVNMKNLKSKLHVQATHFSCGSSMCRLPINYCNPHISTFLDEVKPLSKKYIIILELQYFTGNLLMVSMTIPIHMRFLGGGNWLRH